MTYFYIISFISIISILIYGYYTDKITTESLINKITYNKNIKHCLINYGLILFGLFSYQSNIAFKTATVAMIIQLLILVFIKPIIGVSLIWSALFGLTLLRCKTNKERAFFTVSLLVLIYYALTYPLLPSIAHLVTALITYFYLN
jgi:hypothetical protein